MDCHLRVDGPAASDVGQNFLQRWNMDREPFEDLLDPLLPFKNPVYSKLADLNTTDEPLVENKDGKHAVQVVRTYSCKYDYEAIAPRGELSMFHSRLKAIKMARNYVYIEDQYFLHVPQLMDALLQVLPRLQRVVIVTQPASWATQATGFDKYHWQMLQPLMDKYPRKVQVFAPKADRRIYVHSKLVIVDDVFVSVSSANWNRRSMTTDTELGASVVDSETVVTPDGIRVTKLARDYRVRKFMELSGKSYREIDGLKLLDACDALGAAANDPRSMLAHHKPKEDASFLVFTDTVQDVADPMALCAADP
jgi:phospholipase D1/2